MSTSKYRVRPNLVELESRETPAVFNVTSVEWNENLEGTLPYAVKIANSKAGRDLIQFSFAALGNNITFASDKTLDVLDEVTIQGAAMGSGQSVTIGGTKPFVFSHQTFFDTAPVPEPGTPPPTPSSTIIGVKFKNCTAAGGSGGAVEVTGGDLVLSLCRFESNSATAQGGAVNVGANSQLTVSAGCVFELNTATQGGAIGSAGRVVLTSTVFADNQAKAIVGVPIIGTVGGYGGAIYTTGIVTSDGATFSHNYASRGGGGVYIAHPSKAVENASTFTGGQFQFNRVTETAAAGGALTGDGGGVCVAGGFVKVSGTTFLSNAAGSGGGVSAGANSTVEIKSATFEYNSASLAGGPDRGRAIDVKSGASVSVQGSTFISNGIRGTYFNNGGNTFTNSPDE